MKTKSLIIVLVAVIAIIGIFIIGGLPSANTTKNQNTNENVTLAVNMFNNSKSFSYEFQNISALGLLEKNNTVNVTDSKYGKFVNCINSVCSNNNYYWIYYVNNKEAQLGAASYYVKGNDTIEFKYEKASM